MKRWWKIIRKALALSLFWEAGGREHLDNLSMNDAEVSELWGLLEDIVAIYRKRPGWKSL